MSHFVELAGTGARSCSCCPRPPRRLPARAAAGQGRPRAAGPPRCSTRTARRSSGWRRSPATLWCASGYCERDGRYRYNTAVCVHGDGVLGRHRKVHQPLGENLAYGPAGHFPRSTRRSAGSA